MNKGIRDALLRMVDHYTIPCLEYDEKWKDHGATGDPFDDWPVLEAILKVLKMSDVEIERRHRCFKGEPVDAPKS